MYVLCCYFLKKIIWIWLKIKQINKYTGITLEDTIFHHSTSVVTSLIMIILSPHNYTSESDRLFKAHVRLINWFSFVNALITSVVGGTRARLARTDSGGNKREHIAALICWSSSRSARRGRDPQQNSVGARPQRNGRATSSDVTGIRTTHVPRITYTVTRWRAAEW